jgi:hypothetical protein
LKSRDLSTNLTIDSQSHNEYYQLPSAVMCTAATPVDASAPLEFGWDSHNATSSEYYVYMHFAEVVTLEANQYRSFNITINDDYWYGPFAPDYLKANTLHSKSAERGSSKYEVSIVKTEQSTLPPIINAIEVYLVKDLLQSETDQGDGTLMFHTLPLSLYIYIYVRFSISICSVPFQYVNACEIFLVDAIAKIKSMYEIKRNWQGDPCAPKAYSWEGLNCSYDGDTPPRITSL